MQFRVLTAITVFLGSYLPLSVILLAQNFEYSAVSMPLCWPIQSSACEIPIKNPEFSISAFLLCALCFLTTLVVLAVINPKREIIVVEAKYIPSDLMNYTLPYVVALMSINYQNMSTCVGLIIFLAWMFWITYRSGQVLLNPLLIVFGWRLYDLGFRFPGDAKDVKRTARALSKVHIESGNRHRHAPVGDILAIKS